MDNNFTPADYAAMNGGFGGGKQHYRCYQRSKGQRNQAPAGYRRTCGHGTEYYRQYVQMLLRNPSWH